MCQQITFLSLAEYSRKSICKYIDNKYIIGVIGVNCKIWIKAAYLSDCWVAQLKVIALSHQLCVVQLMRELSNFEDALFCTWSKK